MDRIVDYADIDFAFALEVSFKPGPLQIKGSGTRQSTTRTFGHASGRKRDDDGFPTKDG